MAGNAGRSAAFYLDEFSLQGDMNALSISMTSDFGEDTTYGDSWRSFLTTLKSWAMTLAGFYEGNDTAGELDDVLRDIHGSSGKVIGLLQGKTRGYYGYAANAPLYVTHDIDNPIDGLVTLNGTFQGVGELERCIVLYEGTVTSSSSSTYVTWTQPTSGSELLSNPGFETAGAGGADVWANWTETVSDGALANDTGSVHEGSDAAKITAGASVDTNVYQDITVVAGGTYLLTFWTRGDVTYGGRYLVYDNTNSANIIATTATEIISATYTKFMMYFTAPSGCSSVRIYLYCPSTDTGVAYFDDVSVQRAGDTAESAYISVTATSGTSETLGVDVQHCGAAAGTYVSLSPSFTQATGITSQRIAFTGSVGAYLKIDYTVGGSNPSFSFIVVYHGA